MQVEQHSIVESSKKKKRTTYVGGWIVRLSDFHVVGSFPTNAMILGGGLTCIIPSSWHDFFFLVRLSRERGV